LDPLGVAPEDDPGLQRLEDGAEEEQDPPAAVPQLPEGWKRETVIVFSTVPPGPLQESVYVFGLGMARLPVVSLPFSPLAPVQSPKAVQDVVPVELHASVTIVPTLTVIVLEGDPFAVKVSVGAGIATHVFPLLVNPLLQVNSHLGAPHAATTVLLVFAARPVLSPGQSVALAIAVGLQA